MARKWIKEKKIDTRLEDLEPTNWFGAERPTGYHHMPAAQASSIQSPSITNHCPRSLEVKLPTIWTDETEERRSEKRNYQKKEDEGARKGRISRISVFLHWCVAPEGRKVGSLKRRVRSHLGRQRPTLFQHLSFQKCSGAVVFCTLWNRNALRATAVGTFPHLTFKKALNPACFEHVDLETHYVWTTVGPPFEVNSTSSTTTTARVTATTTATLQLQLQLRLHLHLCYSYGYTTLHYTTTTLHLQHTTTTTAGNFNLQQLELSYDYNNYSYNCNCNNSYNYHNATTTTTNATALGYIAITANTRATTTLNYVTLHYLH